MGKELEVGPEDLVTLLKSGAMKSKGIVISLVEDDPDDEADWKAVKKAVEEKIVAIGEIEKEDEDEEEEDEEEEDEDEDEEEDEEEEDEDEDEEEEDETPPDGGDEKTDKKVKK